MAETALTTTKEHKKLVFEFEEKIKLLPPVEMPVVHDFCDRLYARTIFIPAGSVVTSQIHAEESFFILRHGNLLMTTDEGIREISPGDMLKTMAGTKRALYCKTDCVITTIHPNLDNETDEDKLFGRYTIQENQLNEGDESL